MQETDELLRRLCRCGVEFVIVGGLAAVAHGALEMIRERLRG